MSKEYITKGEFYHHPYPDGAERQCSGCKKKGFKHSYKPANHAHLLVDPSTQKYYYFACWKGCPIGK